jgi:hypothetical protein
MRIYARIMSAHTRRLRSSTAIATAWQDIIPLIVDGLVKPIVERVYPLRVRALKLLPYPARLSSHAVILATASPLKVR